MEKIINTTWYPEQQLIVTQLSGVVNNADIEHWEATMQVAFAQLPDNTRFKMLVNLYGFKAENFEVHKYYRNIIPLMLAGFGYRIGYLDMFPEAKLDVTITRGIRCVAMANVHQDATKMQDYNTRFSSATEKYFTEPGPAMAWIQDVQVQ